MSPPPDRSSVSPGPAQGAEADAGARARPVLVLGMHRSGTSASAGILEDLGLELGDVVRRDPAGDRRNRFNPKGNRENQRLIDLHERILARSGGAWWKPPRRVELLPEDRGERDSILSAYPPGPIAVKEPRLLVVYELWRDLDPLPIGVVRNPASVAGSLARRAQARGRPPALLEPGRGEGLWCTYNRALLAEHERAPFPIVSFERPGELVAALRAALRFHRIDPGERASDFVVEDFFSPSPDDWRAKVSRPEALELWERLDGICDSWREELGIATAPHR